MTHFLKKSNLTTIEMLILSFKIVTCSDKLIMHHGRFIHGFVLCPTDLPLRMHSPLPLGINWLPPPSALFPAAAQHNFSKCSPSVRPSARPSPPSLPQVRYVHYVSLGGHALTPRKRRKRRGGHRRQASPASTPP